MLSSGCEATTVTYTTLLTMWANSKRPEASGRIVEIFKRMQQEGQKNDAISYRYMTNFYFDIYALIHITQFTLSF